MERRNKAQDLGKQQVKRLAPLSEKCVELLERLNFMVNTLELTRQTIIYIQNSHIHVSAYFLLFSCLIPIITKSGFFLSDSTSFHHRILFYMNKTSEFERYLADFPFSCLFHEFLRNISLQIIVQSSINNGEYTHFFGFVLFCFLLSFYQIKKPFLITYMNFPV